MKILSNPTLLTGLRLQSRVQQKLEALADKFVRSNVEPINCAIAKNREDANHWIALKHTGENDGEGIVRWNGVATARFRGEGQNDGLKVIEFVEKYGNLSAAQKSKLGRGFPITTLERLLDTPDVRKLIGLSGTKGQLSVSILPSEAIKPLRKIVLDLASGSVNVTKVKSKKQQIDYVKSLDASNQADTSAKATAKPIGEIGADDFKVKPAPATKPAKAAGRRAASLSDRDTVVPKKFRLTITDAKADEIFDELRHCSHEIEAQRNIQRIWTAARKDVAFLA